MKKILVILWLAALIQGYFVSALSGATVVPNLVLAIVVLYALKAPVRSSIAAGLWAGFWLDIASYTNFGLRAVWFVGAVGLINLIKKSGLETDKLWVKILLVVALGLLYNLSLLLVAAISSSGSLTPWRYSGRWAIEAVINGLLAWLVAPKVPWLVGRIRAGLI